MDDNNKTQTGDLCGVPVRIRQESRGVQTERLQAKRSLSHPPVPLRCKPTLQPAGQEQWRNMVEVEPQRFLTTKELAGLLRVKERRIYDMAAAGDVPCVRLTGKLLFPKDRIDAWMNEGMGNPTASVSTAPQTKPYDHAGKAVASVPDLVSGSHDPLLSWALRQSESELPSRFGGSLDGLERLAKGCASMAGMHVVEPQAQGFGWNCGHLEKTLADQAFVAIAFAKRAQGLIVSDKTSLQSIDDLAGKRVSLRQPGAGSRILFDRLTTDAGFSLDDFRTSGDEGGDSMSETDAAASVALGHADATLGLMSAARQYKLDFIPLIEERFDLVIRRQAYFEPPLQDLLAFCTQDIFKSKADELGGYDLSCFGDVVWNSRV